MTDAFKLAMQFDVSQRGLEVIDNIDERMESLRERIAKARQALEQANIGGEVEEIAVALNNLSQQRGALSNLNQSIKETGDSLKRAFTNLPGKSLLDPAAVKDVGALSDAIAELNKRKQDTIATQLSTSTDTAYYRQLSSVVAAANERLKQLDATRRAVEGAAPRAYALPMGASGGDVLAMRRRLQGDQAAAQQSVAAAPTLALRGEAEAQLKLITQALKDVDAVYRQVQKGFAAGLALPKGAENDIEALEAHLVLLREKAAAARKEMAFKPHMAEEVGNDLAIIEKQAARVGKLLNTALSAKMSRFALPANAVGDINLLKAHIDALAAEKKKLDLAMNSAPKGSGAYAQAKRDLTDLNASLKLSERLHKELNQELASRARAAVPPAPPIEGSNVNALLLGQMRDSMQGQLKNERQQLAFLSGEYRTLSGNMEANKDAIQRNRLAYEVTDARIKSLNKSIRELSAGEQAQSHAAESAAKSTGKLGSALHSTARQSAIALSSSISLAAARAGLGAAAVATGIQALKSAAAFEQQQVAFTSLLGSQQRGKIMLEELNRFAADTQYRFDELTDSVKRLLAYGFDQRDALPVMKIIGDAVSALGGSSEMLNRVVVALGQIRSKGKLSAEEMRQLAEAGIPAWEMLAKHMGVSTRKAMEMSKKGMISAQEALTAILGGMTERFGGMMEKQSRTIEGRYTTLADNVQILMRDLGNDIVDALDLKDRLGNLIIDIKSFTDMVKRIGLHDAFEMQFSPQVIYALKAAVMGLSILITGKIIGALMMLGKAVFDVSMAVWGGIKAVGAWVTSMTALTAAARTATSSIILLPAGVNASSQAVSTFASTLSAAGVVAGRFVLIIGAIALASWLAVKAFDALSRAQRGVTVDMERQLKAIEEQAKQSYQLYLVTQKNVEEQARHVSSLKDMAQGYLELKEAAKKVKLSPEQSQELARITVLLNSEMKGFTDTLDKMPAKLSAAERATKSLKEEFERLAKSQLNLEIMRLTTERLQNRVAIYEARNQQNNYKNIPKESPDYNTITQLDREIGDLQREKYLAQKGISGIQSSTGMLVRLPGNIGPLNIREGTFRVVGMNEEQKRNALASYRGAESQYESEIAQKQAVRQRIMEQHSDPALNAIIAGREAADAAYATAIRDTSALHRLPGNTPYSPANIVDGGGDNKPDKEKRSPEDQARDIVSSALEQMAEVERKLTAEFNKMSPKGDAAKPLREAMLAMVRENIDTERQKIYATATEGLSNLATGKGGKSDEKRLGNAAPFRAALEAGAKSIDPSIMTRIAEDYATATMKPFLEREMAKAEFTQNDVTRLAITDKAIALAKSGSEEYNRLLTEREKIVMEIEDKQYDAQDRLLTLQEELNKAKSAGESDALRLSGESLRNEQKRLALATHLREAALAVTGPERVRREGMAVYEDRVTKTTAAEAGARATVENAIRAESKRLLDAEDFDVRTGTVSATIASISSSIYRALGPVADSFSTTIGEAMTDASKTLQQKIISGLPDVVGNTFTQLSQGNVLDAFNAPVQREMAGQDAVDYLLQQHELWMKIAGQIENQAKKEQVISEIQKKTAEGVKAYAKGLAGELRQRYEMGILNEKDYDDARKKLLVFADIVDTYDKTGQAGVFIRDLQKEDVDLGKERLTVIQKMADTTDISLDQLDQALVKLRAEQAALGQTLEVRKLIADIDEYRLQLADKGHARRMQALKDENEVLKARGKWTAAAEMNETAVTNISLGMLLGDLRKKRGALSPTDTDGAAVIDKQIADAERLLQAGKERYDFQVKTDTHTREALREQIGLETMLSSTIASGESAMQDMYAYREEQVKLAGLELDYATKRRTVTEEVKSVGIDELMGVDSADMEAFLSGHGVESEQLKAILDMKKAWNALTMAKNGYWKDDATAAGATLDEISALDTASSSEQFNKQVEQLALESLRKRLEDIQSVLTRMAITETPQSLLQMRANNPEQFTAFMGGLQTAAQREEVKKLLSTYLELQKASAYWNKNLSTFAESVFDYSRDRTAIQSYFVKLGREMEHSEFSKIWQRMVAGDGTKKPKWLESLGSSLAAIFTGIMGQKTNAVTLPDGTVLQQPRRWTSAEAGAQLGKLASAYGATSGMIAASQSAGMTAARGGQGSGGAKTQGMTAGAMTGMGIASMFAASATGIGLAAVAGGLLGMFEANSAYNREMKRINQEQLEELRKMNNKLTPVSDYFARGGYGAITRTIAFGAAGMAPERAWAVGSRRGYR